MKKAKWIIATTVICALLLATASGKWYKRAGGAYIGYIDTGPPPGGLGEFLWEAVITPDTGNRMFLEVHWVALDPALGGLGLFLDGTYGTNIAETEGRSPLTGEMIKIGRRTWQYTQIGYGWKKDPAGTLVVTYIIVDTGTLVFSDDYQTSVGDDRMAIFAPDSDQNPKDGIPDDLSAPLYVAVAPLPSNVRINVIEPYT